MNSKEVKPIKNMSKDRCIVRKVVEENGITNEVIVEKVENGYFVTISEDGYKGEGDKKEWYSETKKYISKDNPLGEDEKEKVKDQGMAAAIAGMKI